MKRQIRSLSIFLVVIILLCCTSCKKADDESVVSDTEKSVLRSSAVGDAWETLVSKSVKIVEVTSHIGLKSTSYLSGYYVENSDGINEILQRVTGLENHILSEITISEDEYYSTWMSLAPDKSDKAYGGISFEGDNDFAISVSFYENIARISVPYSEIEAVAYFKLDEDAHDFTDELNQIVQKYKK